MHGIRKALATVLVLSSGIFVIHADMSTVSVMRPWWHRKSVLYPKMALEAIACGYVCIGMIGIGLIAAENVHKTKHSFENVGPVIAWVISAKELVLPAAVEWLCYKGACWLARHAQSDWQLIKDISNGELQCILLSNV